MKDLIWRIENFFYKIKNSWKWAKLGWGFHPTYFEYSNIYSVLRFSLQRMIESFEIARDYYMVNQSELQYMRLCIKLIDRLDTDYYEERAQEELDKRWGKYLPWEFEKNEDGITYNVTIKREKEITEEDTERYSADFVKTYSKWRDKHVKARRLLFRILNEKLETWWI